MDLVWRRVTARPHRSPRATFPRTSHPGPARRRAPETRPRRARARGPFLRARSPTRAPSPHLCARPPDSDPMRSGVPVCPKFSARWDQAGWSFPRGKGAPQNAGLSTVPEGTPLEPQKELGSQPGQAPRGTGASGSRRTRGPGEAGLCVVCMVGGILSVRRARGHDARHRACHLWDECARIRVVRVQMAACHFEGGRPHVMAFSHPARGLCDRMGIGV